MTRFSAPEVRGARSVDVGLSCRETPALHKLTGHVGPDARFLLAGSVGAKSWKGGKNSELLHLPTAGHKNSNVRGPA